MVGPHQCLLLLWVVLMINADDGKRDDRNIFLEKAVAGVKTYESLALFTGHSVKKTLTQKRCLQSTFAVRMCV